MTDGWVAVNPNSGQQRCDVCGGNTPTMYRLDAQGSFWWRCDVHSDGRTDEGYITRIERLEADRDRLAAQLAEATALLETAAPMPDCTTAEWNGWLDRRDALLAKLAAQEGQGG